MDDKIGMGIVGADGKILDEDGYETWREEMEKVLAILYEFLNEEGENATTTDHIAEDGKKEAYCGGASQWLN
ncbi:MAG: hypothetical protein IKW45_05415 [Clostridia bacterium]|nr:hypothetical protein [Clostridia bacterium]